MKAGPATAFTVVFAPPLPFFFGAGFPDRSSSLFISIRAFEPTRRSLSFPLISPSLVQSPGFQKNPSSPHPKHPPPPAGSRRRALRVNAHIGSARGPFLLAPSNFPFPFLQATSAVPKSPSELPACFFFPKGARCPRDDHFQGLEVQGVSSRDEFPLLRVGSFS